MRVVLRARHTEVDVEVVVHDPAATVADLAGALAPFGLGGAAHLEVDGCPHAGRTPLADCGVRPGSEINLGASGGSGRPGASAASPGGQPPPAEVRVVGGLAAGDRHRLAHGRSSLGRDPACEVVLSGRTTSRRHATVDVEPDGVVRLADAGSTSGTWIDGRRLHGAVLVGPGVSAALGSMVVEVGARRRVEPAILGRPGADGRRPLHRPPPPVALPPAAPVTPPTVEPVRAEAPRFGWAAALVPLVGGLVLARLVDPRLALFTLLGPAVLVGQWIEERRRHRRTGRSNRAAAVSGLAAYAADLEVAAVAEARRRHTTAPDPAAVGDEVEALGAGLWARRAGHPAFAAPSLGAAPRLRWEPPTTRAPEGPAASRLADARLPHGCPVLVPLSPGHHLGVAGPRHAALAVARWVLAQLAAHHGPSDLRLGVVCAPGRAADWRWVAFLPHVTAAGSSGRRLLGTGAAEIADVAALAGADPSHVVLVVDTEGWSEATLPLARGGAGGPSTLVIGSSRRALASRCTSVLELDGRDGWGQVATADAGPQPLLATGITAATARRWARTLAGVADPDVLDGHAPVPASVRLLDLLDLHDVTPAAVRRRWASGSGSGLAVPIGCTGGPDGPEAVAVDLASDGPHALVAGTTGAGKSELLRSLVAGLAASSPPDRLALLLVDYKGGAAFAEAARLPHVLGVVTDLAADDAARALRSLEAELRRREQVLSELGLRDIAAHPAHRGGRPPPGTEPLPRIVVVVDELAALVTELPSFLDGLVQLAARGRSLGLHLVLGTQRPGGVVSAAVRANCALRCCLRVPDEADAVDVVGSAAPAHLDRTQAGRAFLRRGARDLVEVQVGLVGGRRAAATAPVTVTPATFGPGPPEPAPASAGGDSDLAGLVAACRAAAEEAGVGPPRPLWLPPLPARLTGATLPDGHDDGVVLGVVDDPDHQRRVPLAWRPAEGPLVAIGSGSSPATSLRAAARSLAARVGPDELHVYGFDLAAQSLVSLADLPHVGAIVRAGEHERLHRLIGRLADELAARQAGAALTAGAPPRRPLVLVLVDGVAALRTALEGTGGVAALDALERVVADGAGLGMAVAAAADRPASVPAAWSAAASRRLVFRCGDPLDLLAVGAGRVDQSRWPQGRCVELGSGLVAQVATEGWAAARPAGEPGAGPAPVGTLAACVPLTELLAGGHPAAGPAGLRLPLGRDGRDLGVAAARLRPGQPFVVCGSHGTGRSTTLAVLRRSAEAAGCVVVGAGPDLAGQLATGSGGGGPPLVVVVDDAERSDDPDSALAALAAGRNPGAHLLAAVPPEALRSAFGHWTSELRRAGAGLVLRPRSDLDADVLGIPLLPRWPVPLTGPGRGVLVAGGEAIPVQVAQP